MKITACVGKGGVGKSSIALSSALTYAYLGEKVLVIDADGGRSIPRLLGIENYNFNTVLDSGIERLDFGVVKPLKYAYLEDMRKGKNLEGVREACIEEYLGQFEGNQGILGFYGLLFDFYGVLTDDVATSKFGFLTDLLMTSIYDSYNRVVVDVEPTEGLARLLTSTNRMAGSLKRLGD